MTTKETQELHNCLTYCLEQNGLPYCKNCGLTEQMINDALEAEREEGRREERERIKSAVQKELEEYPEVFNDYREGFSDALAATLSATSPTTL